MPDLMTVVTICIVSIVVLHGFGTLLLRVWGASNRNALYFAPAATIALIACAGLAQQWLHLTFNIFYLMLWWLGAAALGVGIRRMVARPYLTRQRALRPRHHPKTPQPPEPTIFGYNLGYLIFAAFLTSASLAFITMHNSLDGNWSMISQTWDAMPHLNAIRHIIEFGNASPFQIRDAPLINVELNTFYPSVYYQIAATVSLLTGSSAIVSANVTAYLLAGWAFPVGCAALVRHAAPQYQLVGVATMFLGQGLWSFPWAPLGWGVLWPTASSITLVPFAVGAFLIAARVHRPTNVVQRLGYFGFGCLISSAALVAHPRGAIQLIACLWVLIVGRVIANAIHARKTGPRRFILWLTTAAALTALTLFGVPRIYLSAVDPGDAKVSLMYWPINATVGQEIWNYLIQGPNNTTPSITLAVLIILGLLYAASRRRLAWLVLGFLVFATLDILAATSRDPALMEFTRFWYNDRYRITGAVAIFAVPLAAFGVHVVVTCLATLMRRWAKKRPGRAPSLSVLRAPRAAITSAVLVVVFFTTNGLNAEGHTQYLRHYYADVQNQTIGSFVSTAEQEFLFSLTKWVKPHEVVVNLPGDGSGNLYAINGLQPLFPLTNTVTGSKDAVLIAKGLINPTPPGGQSPVCQPLERLNARWVLNSDVLFQTEAVVPFPTARLVIPPGDPRFELVAQGGGMRLYRITMCDFTAR